MSNNEPDAMRLYRLARSAAKAQLSETLIHECSHSLSAIIGDVYALTREHDFQKSKSSMRHLQSLMETARQLDDTVRKFRKLFSDEEEYGECEILTAVREVFKLLEHPSVKFTLSSDVSSAVCALPEERFLQILMEILLNSLRAGSSDVRVKVEIGMRKGEADVAVQIIDNGKGMDEDLLSRACDPFFTTNPEGVGLGLFLSRDSLLRCGGTLSLQSSQGKGTTVTIRLPLASNEQFTANPIGRADG